MVKILAIGDFHGKFPEKLLRKIRKEKFDLIVSPGDFCGSKELGKLFFKYVYGTDRELWEFIGKKKFKELEKRNFLSGIKVLEKLNSFDVPVIIVTGNWDPSGIGEIGGVGRVNEMFEREFKNKIKSLKNIELIDFRNSVFDGINFVGYPRSSYPGFMDKKREEKLRKRGEIEVDRIIKKTREDNRKYFSLFKQKFDENKTNIFISHNCPHNTKLDKIKKGPQKGKHYGSWLAKQIIKKLKPELVICGHMHECYGVQNIGKSVVVNMGAAMEGRAAIIDVDEKREIKVKLIH